MVDAHEVIDIPVPDYSAYPHTQTVLTRADQLVPGDEFVIPEHVPNDLPVIRGQVYRVQLSRAAVAHDGPGWTLVTFSATTTRFRIEPHEEFHKVVEHDPPTCDYCLARYRKALQFAKDHEKRAAEAVDTLRRTGFAAYHRPSPTMEEQLAAQQQESPFFTDWGETDHMRENGAG
jgi:hypothetical protein